MGPKFYVPVSHGATIILAFLIRARMIAPWQAPRNVAYLQRLEQAIIRKKEDGLFSPLEVPHFLTSGMKDSSDRKTGL